jgi:hypothetical protein
MLTTFSGTVGGQLRQILLYFLGCISFSMVGNSLKMYIAGRVRVENTRAGGLERVRWSFVHIPQPWIAKYHIQACTAARPTLESTRVQDSNCADSGPTLCSVYRCFGKTAWGKWLARSCGIYLTCQWDSQPPQRRIRGSGKPRKLWESWS